MFGKQFIETDLRLYGFPEPGAIPEPVFIKRIEDSSGRLIYRFPENAPKEIFSQQTMLQMQDLLKSVIQNGTGRNANWSTDNQSLLGKTGTSSSSRDAGLLVLILLCSQDSGSGMMKIFRCQMNKEEDACPFVESFQ